MKGGAAYNFPGRSTAGLAEAGGAGARFVNKNGFLGHKVPRFDGAGVTILGVVEINRHQANGQHQGNDQRKLFHLVVLE